MKSAAATVGLGLAGLAATTGLLLLAGCALVGAAAVISLRIDVRREQAAGEAVPAH